MKRFAIPQYAQPGLVNTFRSIPIVVSLLLTAAAFGQLPASHAQLLEPNSELEMLIQKAETAVNLHDPEVMKPFSISTETNGFEWTKSRLTPVWKVSILKIPTTAISEPSIQFLAVFHAYHTCENDGDHVHQLFHTTQGWKIGNEILETDTSGYQIKNHDAAITVDLPSKTIHCTDKILVERQSSTKASLLLIRISDDMHISKLSLAGRDSSALDYSQAGGVVAVAAPSQNSFELSMEYSGKADHKECDYIKNNELTLNSYWLPHIARLPASADIKVTTPPGWIPIGQGELIREVHAADGSVTATFHNPVPTCCYTLDAGKYIVTSRKTSGKTLTTYMLTPNPELSSKCLDILEKAMSFYENTFSPYPYKAYTLVETQGAFPGALEAYSFATYGPHTLPGAVVHELAHTWWGGLVPCAYTRSMLDESLAEFSDFLYKQHLSAKLPTNNLLHDPFKVSLREDSKLSNPFNNISLADAHLTFDPFQSAVGYVKGPVVLEQLDIMLGREQMLKSLKSLILHHTLYASIEWKDLESVVHEVTGTSYRWFFEQWVERAGFPSLRLNSVQSKAVNGETEISGELIQDGNPYQLQVPLTLEVSSGPPTHTVIAVSGKTTSFSLRTRQHPIRLLLDPDTTLPLAAQSAEQAGSSPFVFSFK